MQALIELKKSGDLESGDWESGDWESGDSESGHSESGHSQSTLSFALNLNSSYRGEVDEASVNHVCPGMRKCDEL